MRLGARPGQPVYTSAHQVDEQRDAVDVDLDIVEYLLRETRERLALRNFASVSQTVDSLSLGHEIPADQRNALAHGILEANVKLLEEVRRRVLGEVPTLFTDEPIELPAAAAPAAPVGPLLSLAMERYADLPRVTNAASLAR